MNPKPKILLVDDEDRFRTTMRKMLIGHGLDVTDLDSGQAALAALTAQPYDVVVLDLRMPGMDGIQTLQSHERPPSRPGGYHPHRPRLHG